MTSIPDVFRSIRGRASNRLQARAAARLAEPLFEELESRQLMAVDLAVTGVALLPGSTVQPGATVTASVNYSNISAATTSPGTLRIVLSANSNFGDPDDIAVFTGVDGGVPVLGPGLSQHITTSQFTLNPGFVHPGSYYLFASITLSGGDSVTANNSFFSLTRVVVQVAAPAPDLSLTTTLTGGAFMPGQSVPGTIVVRNTGAVNTVGTTLVRYALSTDAIWGNADDIVVNTFTGANFNAIVAGADSEAPFSIAIPGNTPLGAYRLLAFADAAYNSGETNEANNVYAYPVADIVVARPDFVGTISGPAAVTTGTFFTPTVTIRNAGGFVSDSANYTIALRPVGAVNGSTDIILLYGGYIQSLAAGASAPGVTGPIAASAMIPTGAYRVVLSLDSQTDVAEGNEANNIIVSTTITTVTNPGTATLPDLRVAVMPITATVLPNGLIYPYFIRVSNLGTAVGSNFHGHVYLSLNTTLDPSDALISDFFADPIPPTAEFYEVGELPNWLPGGTYYIIADVDSDHEVAESNETNNTGATAFASITIIRPTVSISATDPAAGEVNAPGTANPGVFTVTRTGPTTAPLNVHYTVAGTATALDDYQPLSGSVLIPAGQTSATFTVTTVNDNNGEPTESVIVMLGRGSIYSINLALNRATVNITDNEPTVTVAVVDAIGTEVAAPGVQDGFSFRFTRTGSTAAPLTISYNNGGTSDGGDRVGLLGTAVIPAGQSSVIVNGIVIDDAVGEPAETMTVTVVNGAGYAAGAVSSATATINDNEPIVTVVAIDAVAAQTRDGEAVNNGQVRFTRTGSTAAPLRVEYLISGTAVNGTDYANADQLNGEIEIPAGQSSVTLNIIAAHGGEVVPRAASTTVIIRVTPTGVPFRVANPNNPATVTILSLPPVNVAATNLSFLPSSIPLAAPNQHTPFSYSVSRFGLPGALAAFSVQVRLSANNILGDADDMVLMTRLFAANFTGTTTENLVIDWDTLPLSLPGQYYLGLVVDSGNAISEYHEADNRLLSVGQIQFTG